MTEPSLETLLDELRALRAVVDDLAEGTPDQRISEAQAAELLGYSLSGLRKLRARGDGPPVMRTGPRSRVIYSRRAVLSWLRRAEVA
jgi:hypothetical protein